MSACSLTGRLWDWPFSPDTAGIASTVCSNAVESCRLAPVTVTASGMPRASTTMCRFDPSLPRSVGLGPVSSPSGGLKRWPHQGSLVPNRSGRVHAVGAALPDAVGPIHLQRASRVAGASMSCRCRNRVPAAGLPMGCPFAGHTGCRSVLRGHRPWRRRPPLSDGVNTGINGSSAVHNSLLTFRIAMPPGYGA